MVNFTCGHLKGFWRRRNTEVYNYITLYYIISVIKRKTPTRKEHSQQYSSGGCPEVCRKYAVDVIWNWHSLRRCRRNPEPPCSRSRIAPGWGKKRRVVTPSERYLCAENISRQHGREKAVRFRAADLTLSVFPPTTVWTMCGLCVRKLLTVWKTSRRPSAFTLSRMLLRAMKVPVRPAPALKQKHQNSHKEDSGLPSKGEKEVRLLHSCSSQWRGWSEQRTPLPSKW